jgi:glycine/D-amino acid oxidase-like deaminating enzyme
VSERFAVIVIGGGVVGASTLFQLADLGCNDTVLLERGALASGGTGKSCSIIRTHYSIPSNTELAVRSLELFRDLKSALDDPDAESGFVNSGYLILAGEGDTAANLLDNLAVQRELGANTWGISRADALELHPLLNVSDAAAIGWEPDSGYADPHLTTMSFVNAARRRGASVRPGVAVEELIVEGDRVRGVRTASGDIRADTVVSAVGPWTTTLTASSGIEVPVANYRHTVLTLRSKEPYRRDIPIVKDLTVENKMYFRPESDMILVGTGDYGAPVDDPDDMDVRPDEDLVVRQARQIAHRVPSFADAEIVGSWFGPYDITPDWNPVLGAAPGVDGLYLACGFSGHGFKLAPMVGRVLAQIALGRKPDVDIAPYRLSRFAEGKQLAGVYGSGSIS